MSSSSTSPTQLSLFDFDNFENFYTSHPPTNHTQNRFQAKTAKHNVFAQGYSIEYVLERVKRRSIGLFIEEGFLRIRAPRWVTLKEIESVILEKHKWVIRKLSEQKQALKSQKTLWENGGYFYYLGEKITISCTPEKNAPFFDSDEKKFLLPFLPTTSSEIIKEEITVWLKKQARGYYEIRLSEYAERLGVSYSSFSISNAATLWGICNAKGRILLNWRLITLSENIIDYVIAHELSHLREMNHSPLFWANVESVIPDYRTLRKILNKVSLSQLCATY